MRPPDSRTPCILIADDQPDVLEALRFLVKGEGYQAESVNSPAAAIDAVESRDFDAVLMDLNYTRDTTSGQEGLELLNHIQTLDTTLPVIVMTAWGSVELAVEAMRRGARDFIQKPWDNARLSAILKTQIELGRALRKGQRLEAENRALRAERFPQLIAQSAAMRPVLDVISRVGPSDANVLITGENGTGKGLVAQTLHSVSLRSTRPLVTVNTGGLAEGVFESELFGHVKGAFTGATERHAGRFEHAHGGTLFLDEITELPLESQSKLLRVLQEQEFEPVGSNRTVKVDVRVLAATNSDLAEAVREGRFRMDLYYRLLVIPVEVPPLRERREDIPALAAHFVAALARQFGRRVRRISDATMRQLMAYDWPGNVRELENFLARAVVLSRGEVLDAPLDLSASRGAPEAASPQPLASQSLEDAERFHVERVLASTNWVVEGPKGAALVLDMNPSTLRSLMKRLGIRRPA